MRALPCIRVFGAVCTRAVTLARCWTRHVFNRVCVRAHMSVRIHRHCALVAGTTLELKLMHCFGQYNPAMILSVPALVQRFSQAELAELVATVYGYDLQPDHEGEKNQLGSAVAAAAAAADCHRRGGSGRSNAVVATEKYARGRKKQASLARSTAAAARQRRSGMNGTRKKQTSLARSAAAAAHQRRSRIKGARRHRGATW